MQEIDQDLDGSNSPDDEGWREDGPAFIFYFTVSDDALREDIHSLFGKGGKWKHEGTRHSDESLYRVGVEGGSILPQVDAFLDDLKPLLEQHTVSDGDFIGVDVPSPGELRSKKIVLSSDMDFDSIEFITMKEIFGE